jgi:hypothetical protein
MFGDPYLNPFLQVQMFLCVYIIVYVYTYILTDTEHTHVYDPCVVYVYHKNISVFNACMDMQMQSQLHNSMMFCFFGG